MPGNGLQSSFPQCCIFGSDHEWYPMLVLWFEVHDQWMRGQELDIIEMITGLEIQELQSGGPYFQLVQTIRAMNGKGTKFIGSKFEGSSNNELVTGKFFQLGRRF
mmetsp:Transcript_91571/g.263531  ORF Transcript_91571/g.263531 Transcript_91571/m.263531 type:complete len:105 (-) Transcript_91571:5-319(-)